METKETHTPGPWRVVGADGFALGVWGLKAEDVVDARKPMRQADANLIAAAPELLEVVLSALPILRSKNWSNKGDNLALRASAAIAKAEGR